ncbi:MAG: peptidase M4 family protein, partial [Dokdonella sp.]
MLGLDAESALATLAVVKDADGTTHYRYQQTFRGVPVWGEHIVASDDKSGNLRSLFGRSVGGIAGDVADMTALLSANSAFSLAKRAS